MIKSFTLSITLTVAQMKALTAIVKCGSKFAEDYNPKTLGKLQSLGLIDTKGKAVAITSLGEAVLILLCRQYQLDPTLISPDFAERDRVQWDNGK